ncbi:uncharacterized protein V2V93DRAFT_318447, partial [Kockiozyma suomiensis]|uniref:uncharacterized protein n=1 Tax=Kockiozyma suomiensis TaxID=1337062 RepID=UPI00334400D4
EEEFLSKAQRARPPPVYIRSTDEIPEPILSTQTDLPGYYPLAISDSDAVTQFFEAKFRELQQLVCKIVAKAWIKVIEPKKQSNHPYNKGEEYKPDWWPNNARHREPDHLMKPERLLLLVSMLRSRRVDLKQLRSATLECALNIPKNKMELLEEIYYVADMEEQHQRNPCSTTEALIIWTIALEKPSKSVQAAAAAAVEASSRSLNTIANRMPKLSPAIAIKRELETDGVAKSEELPSRRIRLEEAAPPEPAPFASTEPQVHLQLQQQQQQQYIPVVMQHNMHPSTVLESQSQYLSYNHAILTSASEQSPTTATADALDIFTPRDRAIEDVNQLLYTAPRSTATSAGSTPPYLNPNARRYTTGSIHDSIALQTANVQGMLLSAENVSLYAFAP